jgi:signal transduction histidine kinase
VNKSISLFLREHPEGISVSKDISPGLSRVCLDRAQTQQVVLNLLSNASNAMGGDGQIDVCLKQERGGLALTVRDYGRGMSDSVRQKVFDPFFTTRHTGEEKGMGLGLSIAYQLVRRNGGTIEVESKEGQGAKFTVRFPADAEGDDEDLYINA